MGTMRHGAVAALAAVALVVALAGGAVAQETRSVTLVASATRVDPGEAVTLSGGIAPAAAGQRVEIRDDADAMVAAATTDAEGAFTATIDVERTMTVRAVWGSVESEPVTLAIRATIEVSIGEVRLFDTVLVRGTVGSPEPGTVVEVALLRSGRRVDDVDARVTAEGAFRARFRIMSPGRYRARATVSDAQGLRGRAVTASDQTPLPVLRVGSHGPYVRLLERRLAELRYRIEGVNRRYDVRTGDAVLAFRKVQGLPRVTSVDAATWRALADPRIPRPRIDVGGFHIEVDQSRQVLYTVEGGQVTNVIHVSTGAGGATRDGSFRVYRKLAGFSPNRLYYPSYFDGLRAIHGWTEVPTYPASHGCVRVPYWHARWIFGLVDVGTRITIYHS